MTRNVSQAVRELCLWFPEAQEVLSHGDGRIALWLNAPAGAQHHHVATEPRHFFVPPYVGPRGWLGVNLDKGIAWKAVAGLVRDAYVSVAPPGLAKALAGTIDVKPPVTMLEPGEFDPMQSKRAKEVLARLRPICLSFPETSEGTQFGSPVWRAGRRVFAQAWCYRGDGRLQLGFWVGIDQQALLLRDPLFCIPPYMGHNGWIALDVSKRANWKEIRSLALFSYRHFALQRMLRAMDG